MTDAIKGHYSLVNQIERSATNIGANIGEANYGYGRADFISKFENAFKVCHETGYRLELFKKVNLPDETKSKEYNSSECTSIDRELEKLEKKEKDLDKSILKNQKNLDKTLENLQNVTDAIARLQPAAEKLSQNLQLDAQLSGQ